MKHFNLTILIFGLLLFGCSQTESKNMLAADEKSANTVVDKEEITNLIRQVYKWQETQKPSNNDLITDVIDSLYIGFNLDELKLDIDELKATNLFAEEFIDNYNKIYLTLDKKLRNKEIVWLVGDLPPFGNDESPWCNCSDIPYDKPNPWGLIEVEIVNLESHRGELNWKWGKPELNEKPDWKEFTYSFSVVKENGKWKIAYLEGFNFEEFTRKKH